MPSARAKRSAAQAELPSTAGAEMDANTTTTAAGGGSGDGSGDGPAVIATNRRSSRSTTNAMMNTKET